VRRHRQSPALGYSPAHPFPPHHSTQLRSYNEWASNNDQQFKTGFGLQKFKTSHTTKIQTSPSPMIFRGTDEWGRPNVRKRYTYGAFVKGWYKEYLHSGQLSINTKLKGLELSIFHDVFQCGK
jgi:hypothetical protein